MDMFMRHLRKVKRKLAIRLSVSWSSFRGHLSITLNF